MKVSELLVTPVTEVMATSLQTVTDDAPLKDAAKMLVEEQIAGLPVVTGTGKLVGVIAWSDILRAAGIKPKGAALAGDPLHGVYSDGDVNIVYPWLPPVENIAGQVGKYMSEELFVVPIGATVSTAASVMEEKKVHRVLVVDHDGNLMGIVSASDIVRLLARASRPRGAERTHA